MSTNKIAQLSLLSAACVAGRIAFQFIPNFQPMTAIFLFIVLYLSLKDALIVMSLSIAISSFYFGVGPWVFGQWLSYTVVLALFSIFCSRRTIRRNLWLKGTCFFSSRYSLWNRDDCFRYAALSFTSTLGLLPSRGVV